MMARTAAIGLGLRIARTGSRLPASALVGALGPCSWPHSAERKKRAIDAVHFCETEEMMEGYPRALNTKEDYENVRAMFSPDLWKTDWQTLIAPENLYAWFPVWELVDNDPGVTDDTHRVVDHGMPGEPGPRWQEELRENPEARIFQLGFSAAEVEAALAE